MVVADFHIGDRSVGMETDAHLLLGSSQGFVASSSP